MDVLFTQIIKRLSGQAVKDLVISPGIPSQKKNELYEKLKQILRIKMI